MEQKVFGMTLEEVAAMQKDILGWVDTNHPYVEASRGKDGFRVAFVEGAANLKDDPHSREVFSKILDM